MWIRLSWRGTRSQRSHPTARIRPRNAGAQSAPLRENRLPRYPRVSRRKAIPAQDWSTPRRGGLRTPAGHRWLDSSMSPVGHRPFVYLLGDHAIPGACVRPRNAGAQSAPLRENRPPHYPRVFHPRPFSQAWPPAEGRAPHARYDTLGLTEACLR
jgi:hypothetical protein